MNGGDELTTGSLREHMRPEDISAAWRAAQQSVEETLREKLEALKNDKQAVAGAQEMNAKFAASPDVFDASYGDYSEFLGGITAQVGLPSVKLDEGPYEPILPWRPCRGGLCNVQLRWHQDDGKGRAPGASLWWSLISARSRPGGRKGDSTSSYWQRARREPTAASAST